MHKYGYIRDDLISVSIQPSYANSTMAGKRTTAPSVSNDPEFCTTVYLLIMQCCLCSDTTVKIFYIVGISCKFTMQKIPTIHLVTAM